MKFLKDIYASELDSPDFGLVNIEEKYDADGYLTHDVVIDGKIYSPSKILLDNDEDFNQAFIDWKERKFDELIEKEHGKIGSDSRNEYEEGAQMFIVSEMLKEARKTANMTQEQLAIKAGTKKSYISKIENAKGNIQLSTLIRIFEKGLNKKIGLTFL